MNSWWAIAGFTVLAAAQTGRSPAEGVYVTADALKTAVRDATASGARQADVPIRTIDAGAHVGIGVVYRAQGKSPSGSSSHDKVTEVYQVMEGSGTLVTGGEIVNPQRRAGGSELVGQVNGPGVSGTSINGGVSQHVSPGDMIIIPAGTPHWFSQVDAPITVSVVRVDPEGIVALK